MKASSKPTNTPRIILIAAIFAVLVAGAATYYVYGLGGDLFGWSSSSKQGQTQEDTSTNNPKNDTSSDVDEKPPTDDQVDAGNDIKEQTGNGTSGNTGNVTVTITSAISASNQLKLKTIISKVTDAGTCTLTLSNGSDSKSYDSVGTQALPSYSTCKGFAVDTSGLASGTWKATVLFKDGTSQASVSKDITI